MAVEALREAGCIVLGMVSIFTYCFPVAEQNFKNAGCKLISLTNYESLIELALETGYIEEKNLDILRLWRKDPENWLKY